MGNRQIRFLAGCGDWAPWLTQWPRIALAALLSGGWLSASFATGCEGLPEGPVVFGALVSVAGREPVRQLLRMERSSEVLVSAREQGIDVMLEVSDANGRILARGDTPIRRSGIQRVALPVQAGRSYLIVLSGKEHATGEIELRVIDLRSTANSMCLQAQRRLAAADELYAAGQAVTRAMPGAPPVSSSKAYADAAAEYEAAITSLMSAGPSPLLARAQHAESAVLYQDVLNWQDSRKWAAEARRTYAAIDDAYGAARARALEAAAQVEIAVTLKSDSTSTDSPQRARKMLEDARATFAALAEFHGQRGESHDEGLALNNVGYAYYFEGRYDEAIRAYQQSLPVYKHTRNRSMQALVLQNIALVEYELGRLSAAIPHFQQILELIDRAESPKVFGIILSNSALANWAAGNEDTALRLYSDALEWSRTIQDTAGQAVALHGIASVYNKLGDQTRALDFYRQALALRSATLDVRGRTASLRAIANVLRQQGHADEALKLDREAFSLASAPSTRERIAVQIARDLGDLGRVDEASRELATVLAQRAAGDEVEHARALQERARYRAAAKDFHGAEMDLRSALGSFHTFESPTDEFAAWLSLAQLERAQKKSAAAFGAVNHALALAEEVRLQSANPELRSTLLQPLRPAFDLKISMLGEQYATAQGDTPSRQAIALRALATAEQARARALADYQNLDVTAPGLDARLVERRRTIYQELAARRFRLETTLDRSGTSGQESQAIRSEIAVLRRQLDQIDAQIGAASATNSSLRNLSTPQSVLSLARIPAGVAVVEYWLGEESAFAWVATHERITMRRLAPTARINSEAMALHAAMRGYGSVPRSSRLAAGEQLYAAVLAPIETDIEDRHTLIFAPDGALHYVPFATLRGGAPGQRSFLIENHDVAVTPAIEMLLRPAKPLPSNPPGTKQLLLVSDPVYEPQDPRVTEASHAPGREPHKGTLQVLPKIQSVALFRGLTSTGHLDRLPGATREAAAIAALLPPASVDRLDGLAATRARFLATALDHYRFIHIASHATSDPEIPQASALILSTVDQSGRDIDGRVLAADFMGVRLRADVVVLSGCDTALGRSIAGEGLVGLHYVALARGARSVVSSLWPALDQVTAELMVRFYSTLLHQGSSVISAWSAASRAMLPGRYADPGTWGAFMLTLSHIEDVRSP